MLFGDWEEESVIEGWSGLDDCRLLSYLDLAAPGVGIDVIGPDDLVYCGEGTTYAVRYVAGLTTQRASTVMALLMVSRSSANSGVPRSSAAGRSLP